MGSVLFDSDRYDSDVVVGLISFRVRLNRADILHNFHAFDDAREHGVFVVEPRLEQYKTH